MRSIPHSSHPIRFPQVLVSSESSSVIVWSWIFTPKILLFATKLHALFRLLLCREQSNSSAQSIKKSARIIAIRKNSKLNSVRIHVRRNRNLLFMTWHSVRLRSLYLDGAGGDLSLFRRFPVRTMYSQVKHSPRQGEHRGILFLFVKLNPSAQLLQLFSLASKSGSAFY